MNRDKIYEQLKIDEGVVYKIYHDHLGYPTFGVGHLILVQDPEYKQSLETPVSEERVREVFEKDLDTSISECEALFKDKWNDYPGELQEVLVNMMFNLGRPRLGKFKKFIKAINNSDWKTASIEMMDSRWADQVGPRAKRLRNRVKAL
jgi:GH24 family phage-related lysozyme (muramidase)